MKKGDKVLFSYLAKPGAVGEAEMGFQEGTIHAVKKAEDVGARAMDCSPEELIYWISTKKSLYPKFRQEIIPVEGLSLILKHKLLTVRKKCR